MADNFSDPVLAPCLVESKKEKEQPDELPSMEPKMTGGHEHHDEPQYISAQSRFILISVMIAVVIFIILYFDLFGPMQNLAITFGIFACIVSSFLLFPRPPDAWGSRRRHWDEKYYRLEEAEHPDDSYY
jgi:hypothetical protein